MATVKEQKVETPSGGDRIVTYFMDDQGNPADEKEATSAEIVEYKGGKEIARTYGRFGE